MTEQEAIDLLNDTLSSMKIAAIVKDCQITGPLHRFSIRLVDNERIKQIESFAKEIAIQMRSSGAPIVKADYRLGRVIVDFMFGEHPLVRFEDVVQKAREQNMPAGELDICFGTVEITKPLIRDLTQMPHLLIGGTTGSGKSTALHAIIKSLTDGVITKPKVNLVLLDPKRVEFNRYEGTKGMAIGHSAQECLDMILTLQALMKDRLIKLANKKCQNIREYHQKGHDMSYVAVLIDELADPVRVLKKRFSMALCDLAEKSRAAGIHLVISTQDPRREIVDGAIKANFPARLGFHVVSGVHSKIVIDRTGAEKLAGKGDAILIDGSLDIRLQGAFVDSNPQLVVEQPGFFKRLIGRA